MVSLQSLLLEKALMTLFLHSMHGENPALPAGLEACPNSRHKSKKAEKQETVIVLLVNMYTYIQLMRQNLKKYV